MRANPRLKQSRNAFEIEEKNKKVFAFRLGTIWAFMLYTQFTVKLGDFDLMGYKVIHINIYFHQDLVYIFFNFRKNGVISTLRFSVS